MNFSDPCFLLHCVRKKLLDVTPSVILFEPNFYHAILNQISVGITTD